MIRILSGFWIAILLLFLAKHETRAQDIVPILQETLISDSTEINKILNDSININSFQNDSINLISLQNDSIEAISIIADSIPVRKNNTLDGPVHMTAKDSMIMVMEGGNMLFLYGSSTVKYKDINLEADYIEIDGDSNNLFARYETDSLGAKTGFPVFTSNEQKTDMDQLWYNFKTTKMFTKNAKTQQGEGYIIAEIAKKMPDDSFNMHNMKYTTCDDPDCPHFYFNIKKGKFKPGKSTITGLVYLVVEDVPLPIGAPFGYFPTTSSYSSGILMPTYGDEMARGFSLRDGGYYFAISDYIDAEIRGEIYTKGSWGLSARSAYKKLYKYNGNLTASYLVTVIGDKDSKGLPDSDYSQSRDIKVNWSHQQDPKSNPYGTFSASVNFSTSSFNRNDFRASTLNQITENTKVSSVSYSYRSPTLPLSMNTSASISQTSRDSTLSVSFPDVTISLSSLYPFKRKEQIGSERWYEKIYLTYTGTIKNSINNVKENEFFKKNMIKDWRNGIKHSIPVSASFNLMKYITISTSFNYNENWYSSRVNSEYNYQSKRILPVDTTYGFFRTYNYNASLSMNTKLYGIYKPWALFGKWTKGVQIRHVLTPSVSLSGAPDFSDPKLGMYKEISYFTSNMLSANRIVERHSIYQNQLFGNAPKGKTGALNFSLDNNLEAKAPIAGTDSTRKISLIDNFRIGMSYNFLADSMNWSNMSTNIRLKLFGQQFSLAANFETYIYNENGRNINVTRWKAGKGLGRFMGTSTGYNYTFNNETLKSFKRLFVKGDNDSSKNNENSSLKDPNIDEDENSEEREKTQPSLSSKTKSEKKEGEIDSDGYLVVAIPWSLSFNYSVNLGYDRQNFNKVKREYPYKLSHTLGFTGEITPTKAWKFSFGGSFDFDTKSIVNMYCSLTRQMHCWSMSASFVPFGPMQNYSFHIAVNSSLLQDVKYQQRSNYRDAQNWGGR